MQKVRSTSSFTLPPSPPHQSHDMAAWMGGWWVDEWMGGWWVDEWMGGLVDGGGEWMVVVSGWWW